MSSESSGRRKTGRDALTTARFLPLLQVQGNGERPPSTGALPPTNRQPKRSPVRHKSEKRRALVSRGNSAVLEVAPPSAPLESGERHPVQGALRARREAAYPPARGGCLRQLPSKPKRRTAQPALDSLARQTLAECARQWRLGRTVPFLARNTLNALS
jgi:hypothetical protein